VTVLLYVGIACLAAALCLCVLAITGWATRPSQAMMRVVAVGQQGSGKTVFLSSLFHCLNHPSLQRYYHLELPAGDAQFLTGVYAKASDPEGPWPDPTPPGEERMFPFECVGRRDPGLKDQLFGFEYLDYGGEILGPTPGFGEHLNALEQRVGRADALIGIIDGRQVLKLLEGDRDAQGYFDQGLQLVTHLMQCASAPIQLVVTKWDLVHDFAEPRDASEDERLQRVGGALKLYEHIAGLPLGRGQPIRLIPVSAVGYGFAQRDASEPSGFGKRPDATPQQKYVDVPLAAVFIDLFAHLEHSLDEGLREQFEAWIRARRWEELLPIVKGALADILHLTPVPALAMGFVDWQERRLAGSPKEPRLHAEFDMTPHERCLRKALQDFHTTMILFDLVFPSSVLNFRHD
jgi:hypothetical protein